MNREPIRVFLGRHLTAGDAYAAADEIQQCDVFVPELAGWNEPTVRAMNMVASGHLAASAIIGKGEFDDFSAAQLLVVSRTGKRVVFADVPEGDPLADELHELAELVSLLEGARRPWGEVCASLEAAYLNLAEANVRREAHIVGRIGELVVDSPGDARILVRLGMMHMPVVRELAAKGITARAVFQRPRPVSDTDSMLYRYARSGRIPIGAIARHLLAGLVRTYWLPAELAMKPSAGADRVREVVWTFTLEQVRELWELYVSGKLTRHIVAQRVHAHGFPEAR